MINGQKMNAAVRHVQRISDHQTLRDDNPIFSKLQGQRYGKTESAGICAVGFSDGVVYFPVKIVCFFSLFLKPCARFAVLLISLASHTVCKNPNTEKGETI